ncbi:MAG: hypothetical protein QME96_17595, partial [Myxococcota bacterium]|nr:hypothetical protein [Myxococcota bacterium]
MSQAIDRTQPHPGLKALLALVRVPRQLLGMATETEDSPGLLSGLAVGGVDHVYLATEEDDGLRRLNEFLRTKLHVDVGQRPRLTDGSAAHPVYVVDMKVSRAGNAHGAALFAEGPCTLVLEHDPTRRDSSWSPPQRSSAVWCWDTEGFYDRCWLVRGDFSSGLRDVILPLRQNGSRTYSIPFIVMPSSSTRARDRRRAGSGSDGAEFRYRLAVAVVPGTEEMVKALLFQTFGKHELGVTHGRYDLAVARIGGLDLRSYIEKVIQLRQSPAILGTRTELQVREVRMIAGHRPWQAGEQPPLAVETPFFVTGLLGGHDLAKRQRLVQGWRDDFEALV